MELRSDAMLFSTLGNEHSDAGESNVRAGRIWPTARGSPSLFYFNKGLQWSIQQTKHILTMKSTNQ